MVQLATSTGKVTNLNEQKVKLDELYEVKSHFGDLDELEAYIERKERIYNTPEEEDLWSNHKTTVEDYDLYELDYDLY